MTLLVSVLIIVGVLVSGIFIYINVVTRENKPLPYSSLITPYVYEDNITFAGPFALSASCPGGHIHGGLDFLAYNDSPFRAVIGCELVGKEKFFNPGNGYWQVNLQLKYNRSLSFNYAFEPFSPNESDADQQLAMIIAPLGASLNQGDIIGSLLALDPSAHVHWHINFGDDFLCPEPYFTPAANLSIMTKIWNFNTSWSMCCH